MELFVSGSEDELELSNQPDEDEEYTCSPIHKSTEKEEEEEELVFFRCHGKHKQQEEYEEMDEEQQVLCEGSCHLSNPEL